MSMYVRRLLILLKMSFCQWLKCGVTSPIMFALNYLLDNSCLLPVIADFFPQQLITETTYIRREWQNCTQRLIRLIWKSTLRSGPQKTHMIVFISVNTVMLMLLMMTTMMMVMMMIIRRYSQRPVLLKTMTLTCHADSQERTAVLPSDSVAAAASPALYGAEICLLDATYKTSRYALPLFFVCVKTNVNYAVVASFFVQSEDTQSIAEALSIIHQWNPDWCPLNWMVDFCEAEIHALESVFPGESLYMLIK